MCVGTILICPTNRTRPSSKFSSIYLAHPLLSHLWMHGGRYHDKAVRGVHFHPSYPLVASCSDDGKLHIFHGMVYSDLLTNALIVPVKIINAHKPVSELGVLDCVFHPTQPWVFSAGADKAVRLFT